jgi:hypothetical protein
MNISVVTFVEPSCLRLRQPNTTPKERALQIQPVLNFSRDSFCTSLFLFIVQVEAQFNTPYYSMVWDSASIPSLKAFKAAFASRPKLDAYIASDRRMPWAGDSMM